MRLTDWYPEAQSKSGVVAQTSPFTVSPNRKRAAISVVIMVAAAGENGSKIGRLGRLLNC